MDDYNVLPNYEFDDLVPGARVLPKAIARTRGGMLTNNVQQSAGMALPQTIAGYRQREADLYKQGSDLYNAEPDMSQMQEYARQRGEQGQGAMLNALAAQFAGESFQPVQAQYLKRAAAAQDPMKLGGGMLTPEGRFIKDPGAAQDKKAEFLLQQAKAYGAMASAAETRQEQQAYRAQQDQFMNELRTYMAQTGRMQADTARDRANAAAGGGELGFGTATQIGSGPANEPVFRMRDGRLFTYDQQGSPTAYTGQVMPKAGNSFPTEDERKSAGYVARIDQGLRLLNDITKQTPGAAKPGATATALSQVPLVGNMASNIITPAARQRVEAAQLDMLDAALTLATGAAYTKEQLQGISKSYFVQIGDDPQTIKDKQERLKNVIETARIRAGRALPGGGGGGGTPGAPAAGAPADPLGMRK